MRKEEGKEQIAELSVAGTTPCNQAKILLRVDDVRQTPYTCIMAQVNKRIPKSPKHAACCASELDSLLDPELFKALGDPTRVKLLSCLARCARACSTTEVAECCSVDFSVVTRHLTLLADVGALECEKQGRTVYYTVRYDRLSELFDSLAGAIADCCTPPMKRPRGKHGCC